MKYKSNFFSDHCFKNKGLDCDFKWLALQWRHETNWKSGSSERCWVPCFLSYTSSVTDCLSSFTSLWGDGHNQGFKTLGFLCFIDPQPLWKKWLSKLEFKRNSIFFCPDLACTDSSGAPHAVGEIWRTSLSGCCMQKCVDSETIIPVEYNCSEIHNLECQRFAEVALLVPDDQTCCPQKICSKYSFMVVDTAHWNLLMSYLWGLLSCYACYFWRK